MNLTRLTIKRMIPDHSWIGDRWLWMFIDADSNQEYGHAGFKSPEEAAEKMGQAILLILYSTGTVR